MDHLPLPRLLRPSSLTRNLLWNILPRMDTQASTEMVYDGPEVDGRMEVRELSPALLAMGDLLADANNALNGGNAEVSVFIKADFRAASFHVWVDAVIKTYDVGKALWELHPYVDAEQLLIIVGAAMQAPGGPAGLIQLVKWLKGRPITSIEPPPHLTVDVEANLVNGIIRVHTEGEANPLEVINGADRLISRVGSLRALDGITAPLERPGIQSFRFRQDQGEVVAITQEERPYFALPPAVQQEVVDAVIPAAIYQIISPVLEGDTKWRLHDGSATFSATIKDREFLREVESGAISFRNGDSIKAEMRFHQSSTPDGRTKTEREVLRVLDYVRGPGDPTIRLFDPEE